MSNTPPWEPLDEPQQQHPQTGERPSWGPQWQPQQPNHQPPYGGQQVPWSADQQLALQPPYAEQPWPPQQAGGPQVTTQIPSGSPNGHRAGPPRKSHRRRNVILAVTGAFFIIGAIGDVLGAGKTPSPKPAAATTPAARATTPAPAAATAPPAAATTAPAQETTAQKVIAWYENGGQGALNSIVTALGNIQQQGQDGNFPGAAQACAGLSTAVTNTEALGAIPFPRAEKWLARGLAQYQAAAAECQAGASTEDTSELALAVGSMSKANADIARATKLITALP
jgi:hypothetical protein